MHRQRLRAALYAGAGLLLALTLACGLSGAAVRRGLLAPPNVNLTLGVWRLVGGASRLPECSQLINPGCVDIIPVPVTYIYTLWLFTKTDRQSWDNPRVRRLLVVELGRR